MKVNLPCHTAPVHYLRLAHSVGQRVYSVCVLISTRAGELHKEQKEACLLYTSDAADE